MIYGTKVDLLNYITNNNILDLNFNPSNLDRSKYLNYNKKMKTLFILFSKYLLDIKLQNIDNPSKSCIHPENIVNNINFQGVNDLIIKQKYLKYKIKYNNLKSSL